MASITISRGTKSGGIKLAEMLAKRLGYHTLSREVLVESTKKYGIDEDVLQRELTKPPNLWERFTHERRRYLVFVRCSLLQALTKENIVYHGNAGQVLLEGTHSVLRVRIDAPFARRVEAEMRALGVDREEATAQIRSSDEERRRWVKYLYERDWDDAALYDLTINLATMSLETACDLICYTVREPEFQETDEVRRQLEDICLQCEVEAALASDDALWKQHLAVRANRCKVTVHGEVENEKQKARVEAVVSKVDGVREHVLHVGLASDPLLGVRRPWS